MYFELSDLAPAAVAGLVSMQLDEPPSAEMASLACRTRGTLWVGRLSIRPFQLIAASSLGTSGRTASNRR